MEEAVLSAVGIVGLVVAVAYMLARRLHVPIVVIYLLVGALAGPSLLGLVDPHELGEPFHITLELLVALIVFEGAFSIDVAYLRRVGRVVRNLLTVGLAITFLMATLLAGLTDVLPWRAAFMFGALVTVTGPTVIGPLVRSIRLNDHVRAVLLGEGVLIDPVGALVAIVVLDFTLSGLETSPLLWAPSRLLGGAALALVGFAIVRGVLWLNREPSSAETSLLLFGASIATFGLAERVLPGSGLTAVAVLGVSLAATKIPHAEDVRSFEDDLSRLMIGAVYVLAVATVDLALLRQLWPMGFLVVASLMVLVRPAVVHICAIRSDLTMRERTYIGLIGPRGIVAASLAAVAGEALGPDQAGPTLTALVFLTILLTVATQSTYAGPLADWLRVRAMKAVIAGAGRTARQLGTQLAAGGFDVVLADLDAQSVARARAAGLAAEIGDVTDMRFLAGLGADRAELAVGATDNDQSNLLFC
ncbi:MAG: cation:proton antiporter [Chloroflexi bacterium]|nr:cation:proton antiporter [Chloroflexota bacterium]MDA1003719.1 cation:proton antiporter [Chloroflexota bacterium]